MQKLSVLAAGAVLLLAGFNPAAAVTVTGTGSSGTADMTVSIEVAHSCDFSVTSNVNFGTPSPVVGGATAPTPGQITATCTQGTEFSIALEAAPVGGRTMVSGTNSIPYSLTLDPASNVSATGTAQTFGVTGTLGTISSRPPAGSYSDTVTVTLTVDATQTP